MSVALNPRGLVSIGLTGVYVPGEIIPPATPPVLTLPKGENSGPYSALGSVTTDLAGGTLYYLTTQSPTATAAAVKAAGTQPVTAAGVQAITITGLSAATTYYNHFLHARDGVESEVASSAEWATVAAPVEPVEPGALMISEPLKNNTGMLHASAAYRCLIWDATTGELITIAAGTTSSGAVIGLVTHPSLVAARDYYVIIEVGVGGAHGLTRVTAT